MTTTGWSVEETLDVQTVHSVCPSCHIILVESNSNANSDLGAAENTAVRLGANEVTNSFGEPESDSSSSYQADFNHRGVVITASAGDDGYYSFDDLDGISEPSAPAAYNTTVSVGGTSLYLGQGGNRQSETVWNDNGPRDYYEQSFEHALGAGGGGCSTLFSAQKWQTSLGVWGSTGCGTKRLVSDVSAVADYLTGFDIYDTYNCGNACSPAPGWFTLGGTSLSSPLIAAVYALAGGAHRVAYPALTLYGHLNHRPAHGHSRQGRNVDGHHQGSLPWRPGRPLRMELGRRDQHRHHVPFRVAHLQEWRGGPDDHADGDRQLRHDRLYFSPGEDQVGADPALTCKGPVLTENRPLVLVYLL
jgi:Subtilase family